MDNVKTSWWASHRPSKRRLVQLYCALLYNAHIKGFLEGKIYKSKTPTTKVICVPGFNCYSCPGAVGACPLGSLQNAIGTSNKQIGFYVFGILMLYRLILGTRSAAGSARWVLSRNCCTSCLRQRSGRAALPARFPG